MGAANGLSFSSFLGSIRRGPSRRTQVNELASSSAGPRQSTPTERDRGGGSVALAAAEGNFAHAHSLPRSLASTSTATDYRLSKSRSGRQPARGWQQRESERASDGGAVHRRRRRHLWRQRVSTNEQTKRTNSGRKGLHAAATAAAAAAAKRIKSACPTLRSAGCPALPWLAGPAIQQNERTEPASTAIEHFLFSFPPPPPPPPLKMQGVMGWHGRMASCACSVHEPSSSATALCNLEHRRSLQH